MALDAWRNLTLTTGSMAKSMEKLSSGFRINRAADDPAGLVISEQFRAQIAGLNKAVQNSEGSINMIQTAEGALTEINNLLVGMRELAIHAANEGFNDETQLAADQAEITNAISTINRIAVNTQFGTKKLLDGAADNVASLVTGNNSQVTLSKSGLLEGAHSITATKLADASGALNISTLGLSSPESVTNLEGKVHNFDVVQSSAGATKTGTAVYMQDAWNNYLRFMAGGTVANVAGTLTNAAGTAAATITFQINYQENGNNPVGIQTIAIRTSALSAATATAFATEVVSKLNTAINGNSLLSGKVSASNTGGAVALSAVNKGAQYSVYMGSIAVQSTDSAEYDVSTWASKSGRGASAGTITFSAYTAKAQYSNVSINLSGTVQTISALAQTISTSFTAALGTATGSINNVYATAVTESGVNKLKIYTVDQGSKYNLQVVGGTSGSANAQTALGLSTDSIAVHGRDALVSLDGYTNTIDDVRYWYDSASPTKVTLYNGSDPTTRGSFRVTVAPASTYGQETGENGVKVGNMLLDIKAPTFGVRLDGGPEQMVDGGKEYTIWNAARDQSINVKYALSSAGGTEQIQDTDQSLVFQIGANVGQTARIGLPNMKADYLGRNIAGNMFSSLAKIDVTTSEGAQDAQAVIDKVINEVTTVRGTLGSFQKNTLESNLTNLRIAAQNLTASESTIRDTDMAKEMAEYVKTQILLQAGTAMLAQGNQVPQVVLSLFK
jgi:flagellin